jgi:PhnB protein
MVHFIPEGVRTVTPHLVVKGASKAIDFYKAAFGAVELHRMTGPGGSLAHAEMQISDSRVFIADEFPGGPVRSPKESTSVVMHLYVPDADATFARAVAAGAKVAMPLMDAFWGDRYGQVRDPFGHVWSIATHKQDLSPEEMQKAGEAAMSAMPAPRPAKASGRKKPSKPKARKAKAKGKKAARKRR